MKVAELIAKLQRMNPDAEVVAPEGEHHDLEAFRFVGYNPEDASQVILDWSDWRWQCREPLPHREPSASDLILREYTNQFIFEWIASHAKLRQSWPKEREKIGSTLRIRMPEDK